MADNAYSDYRAGRIGYAEMVLSRRAFVDLSLQELQLRSRLLQLRMQCWSVCETPEAIP
ncbi:MAG: hypothetical protein N2Z70_05280 [Bdellovibrionaceae bacterium]|nr:hypothetical protein [Pseudobdellovibrionaceae bacterium]